jgi:GntR family transcriptional regulator
VTLPRYLEISERLTREIAAGLRPDGARLPPEAALADELGVAVGTLRKALAELAARGLLVRRQGSGNYVRRSAQPVGIYGFLHLELAAGGGLPGARTLEVARVEPPEGAAWAGAWRIRRVRTLNGAAAALEEIWIDARHAPALTPADLPETLYRHYAAAWGLWIARVEDRVGPGALPDWAPAGFPLAPGAICGHVARRAESRERRVEEISRTWFDPDVAAYVARWHEDAA